MIVSRTKRRTLTRAQVNDFNKKLTKKNIVVQLKKQTHCLMKSQRHPSLHLFVLDLSQRSISLVVSEGLMEFLCKQDGGAPLNVCCKQANEQMKSKVMSSLTRGDGWCTEEMQAGKQAGLQPTKMKTILILCILVTSCGSRDVIYIWMVDDVWIVWITKKTKRKKYARQQQRWNRICETDSGSEWHLSWILFALMNLKLQSLLHWVYRIFLLISIRSGI